MKRILLSLTVLSSLLCLAAANLVAADDQLLDYLRENRAELSALAGIKDADSLRFYYVSLPIKDRALRVVYFSRMMEMRPDSSVEIGLLETLPQSHIELSYVYRLTYRPLGNKNLDSTLNSIYYGYFETVSKALLKHRSFVQNYFRFAALLEGESAEAFESWPSFLVSNQCVWFFENLAKAHPQVESAILDYLQSYKPDMDCLNRNRSRIPTKYVGLFAIRESPQGRIAK
jgi:hypothetical protein